MKSNFKGFTLVEMLIVIVIIGVLVSAFVPRFKGIRENANDIARKSHVQTIANALLTYNSSEGDYPDSDGCVASLQGKLTQYLTTIPQDPQANKKHAPCATNGSYAYRPIAKTV
jgi:type II secretion system protein G